MKTGKRKVAIFDIDGTIFRSSLLIELVEVLITKGFFPAATRNVYAKARVAWLERKGSYEDYIMAVVKAFDTNLHKISYKDFKKISQEVINVHKHRVYVYTRDLIGDLKKKGYFILAISHSPKEVLDNFCKHYGFDKVYGRIYEVAANGKFTGKTLHLETINDKSAILERAIKKEGLTLKGSVGVGDTESDIKFLSLVDDPICFNPNSKLCAHAELKGWKIVVERKDVIYEI